MTETPRHPSIRAELGFSDDQERQDDTVEIPIPARLRQRSAIRRSANRASAAIQQQDGRKLMLALTTMVVIMAIIIVFPRAELSARAISMCIAGALILVWLRVLRGNEASGVERARAAFDEGVVAPSRKAKRILIPGEKPWYEEQEHPIVLIPWLLGWLGCMLLAALIPSWEARLTCMGVVSLIVGLVAVYWKRRRYCFTDWRVFSTEGIISRNVRQMTYGKMTDLKHKVPWHSLLLMKLRFIDRVYGTLVLESAGQDQALHRIPWLRDVESVHLHLSKMSAPNEKGDDGT